MKNPIVVALDVENPKEAEKIAGSLQGVVGGFKVGPRLTLKADKSFLKDLSQSGVLFLDHKFYDIPSVTAANVQGAFDLGAHWVTVHALAGSKCLQDLSVLEKELATQRPGFRVVAVTVLTSYDQSTLPPIWKKETIEESVVGLAQLSQDSGLSSVVCSPQEVASLKSRWPQGFYVVPGIRPVADPSDDQTRVATPKDALKAGSSALIIGRPIVKASDPKEAAQSILSTLELS